MSYIHGPYDKYNQFLKIIEVMVLDREREEVRGEEVRLRELIHAFGVSPYCLEQSKVPIRRMAEQFVYYSQNERPYLNRPVAKRPDWLIFQHELEEHLQQKEKEKAANEMKQQQKERKKESVW